MMTRWAGLGACAVLAFAASATAGDVKWAEYKWEAGKCSVMLPGTPEKLDSKDGGVDTFMVGVDGGNHAYLLGYTDTPQLLNASEDDKNSALNNGRDTLVKNLQGKLAKETKFKLGDVSGRELYVEVPALRTYRTRIFLHDGRLYQLVVMGRPEFVVSKDAERFLDSFKFLVDPWTEYKWQAGKCSILMPGAPKESIQTKNGVETHVLVLDAKEHAHAVIHSVFPSLQNATAEQKDAALDNGRDTAVKNVKGKVLKETKIQLGGHPGRELLVDAPAQGMYRARLFVVGNRLYQVLVGGAKEYVQSKDADKFLDSFKLMADAALVEYRWESGKCTMLMPGAPEKIAHKDGAEILVVDVARNLTHFVRYTTHPALHDASESTKNALLNKVRDGLVKSWKGKIVTEFKLERGELSGREMHLELQVLGSYRARLFLRGDRLYEVVVAGAKEHVFSKDADGFLDSFQFASEIKWMEYKWEAGNCAILMPGVPRKMDDKDGGAETHMVGIDEGNRGYLMSYTVAPHLLNATEEAKNAALDMGRDALVNGFKAKLVKESNFKVGDLSGRELLVEMPVVGIYRTRLLIRGDRLYQLVVLGPKEFATSTDADKFLDSFKFLAAAKVAETKWTEHKWAAGKCSILLPGAPKEMPANVGGLQTTVLSVDGGTRYYMLAYTQVPTLQGATDDAKNVALDNCREGNIQGTKGKLVKETKISLGGHPGRELHIDVAGVGVYRARIYIVGDRLYQIVVGASSEEAFSKESDAYFNSFQLAADAAGAGWTQHNWVAGKCNILMPGMPKETERKGGDGIDTHLLVLDGGKQVHFVSYTSNPRLLAASEDQKNAAVDHAREALLKSLGGKVAKEAKIKVGDLAGRELHVQAPGLGIYRVRYFIHGDRLYQVVVAGPEDFANSKDADKYLDSFAIVGQQTSWLEHAWEAGKCSVLLPGAPREITDKDGGRLVVDGGTSIHVVSYKNLPVPGPKAGKNADNDALDEGRTSTLMGLSGKLVQEIKIAIGGRPGREWHIEAPALGTYRVRAFVAGGRLYRVMVGGPSNVVHSKESDRYLDSFKLAAASKWVEYQWKAGKCTVLLPGVPKEMPSNIGGIETVLLIVDGGKHAHFVGYSVIPALEFAGEDERNDALDKAREGALQNVPNGKLAKDEKIKHGALSGREVTFEAPGVGVYRVRYFIHGDRLYQLMVGGSLEFVQSKESQRFFESFKISGK